MFRCLSPRALGLSLDQSELIELALSNGFRSTDLDIVEFCRQAAEQGLERARRYIDSAKLRIASFDLPFSLDDEAAFKAGLGQLDEWAGNAARLGCTRCLAWITPGSDRRPYHENFEYHRQRLGELAGKLAGVGVRLGVGFRAGSELRRDQAFQFIHDPDALTMLLSMVGEANVGMVVDAWDMWASGQSLEAVRKIGGERIVAVFVADAPENVTPGEVESTLRLMPGQTGVVNLTAVLETLAEAGYEGPITPAPHPSQLQGMGREAIVKLAGQRLDEAWKAAGLSPAGKRLAARK